MVQAPVQTVVTLSHARKITALAGKVTAGKIAAEAPGDLASLFRGGAPAAVGDVLGSPAARSGIVDTSWMWDRPSTAPGPLKFLNDIRQDASGAGLGAKQGLRQAQDDIWRDYLGNNINSRHINPDGYVELEARMQELRNEHGLRNLFGAGVHGLADDAAGQYGEIYRHAQGAGDELRNAQGYRIGDLIGQVTSPLRGALMGDSGLATSGNRYNLGIFDYAPGQNPDITRAQPTPSGLGRILKAMPGEGYAVTPGAASRAKRRAMEAAPEDIGRLLTSYDAPAGTLMDQLRGLFDIGDPSLWLGANHQALYDAKYPQRFLQRYSDYTPQQLLDLVTSQSTGGRNQWVDQLDNPFDLRQLPYPGY